MASGNHHRQRIVADDGRFGIRHTARMSTQKKGMVLPYLFFVCQNVRGSSSSQLSLMEMEKVLVRLNTSPVRVVMRFCLIGTSVTVKFESSSPFVLRTVTVTSVVSSSSGMKV